MYERQWEETEQKESFFSKYATYIVFGGGGLALFATGVAISELFSYNNRGRTRASAMWSRVSECVSRTRASRAGTAIVDNNLEADTARPGYAGTHQELQSLNRSGRLSGESADTSPCRYPQTPTRAHLAVGSLPPATEAYSHV